VVGPISTASVLVIGQIVKREVRVRVIDGMDVPVFRDGFDRLGESKCSAHQNTSLRNLLPVHNPTQKSYSGEHLPCLSITLLIEH
jgi:hypothetical protein